MPSTESCLRRQEKHQEAIRLFEKGQYEQAARLLKESLEESESSDRWNDWATAQLACHRPSEAERGFRRALEMDPQNTQAAANLGALLSGMDRYAEAIAHLEKGMAGEEEQQRAMLESLLEQCRRKQDQTPRLVLSDPTPQAPLRAGPPRKRIVITGDVLRPMPDGTSHQALNIQWFANLFRYPLSLAADAGMEQLSWDGGEGSIDAVRFYEANGLLPSLENWARLFDAREISASSAGYLSEFFEEAVIIGFEMPDVMLRHFHTCGIPYLDFFTHPVRYLDDLLFGVRTNVADVFEALGRHAIPEEQFYLQAGVHTATVNRMPPLGIRPNSCLFVGQTPMDKSLIADGRLLTPADFAGELKHIARSHDRLYYKPHPYGSDEESTLSLLDRFAEVEVTRANIYHLLGQENLRKVAAISSSVLHEAEYFGKEVAHLSPRRLSFHSARRPAFDPWAFVPVYDAFYNPRFWADVLQSVCRVKDCPSLTLPQKANRLRTTLHIFWGYNFLDTEMVLHNIRAMGGFDFGQTVATPPETKQPAPPEQAPPAPASEAAPPVSELEPPAATPPEKPPSDAGILFQASVYGGSGYSEECLAVVLGLAQRQFPVRLEPLVFQNDTRNLLSRDVQNTLERLKQASVNLSRSVYYQCVPAHDFNLNIHARYRVGRTMFESDRIPAGWAERCKGMDEIWVPSEFNRETFAASGVAERKLRVVPAGVDTKAFRPGLDPLPLSRLRGFNFLSVFEWTDRKGADALLRAYLAEFKPDEDVTLILKTYARPDPTADLLPRLAHFVEREAGLPLEKAPPILLLTGFLSNQDVPRLYNTASCFVLPTRGEGYGRPFMEALACGVPVIGTAWSGQMDFLNDDNSYLVEPEAIVPVPADVDVELYAGHCWAEPSVDHLRQCMREAFSHRQEAQRLAARGHSEMIAHWDWEIVIQRWAAEFERLLDAPFQTAASPSPSEAFDFALADASR